MKFLCPNCKAKYQIADEKVSGRTLRMDCRRCGHNITIRADMAIDDVEDAAAPKPAPAPAAKPASASASTRRAGLTGAHGAQPAGGALGGSLGGSLGADFHRSVSKPHTPGLASGGLDSPRTTPLDQWHVAINDVPVGPLRREEIVKKIGAGAVTADSLCWREGLDDWRPLRDVPELAALLRRSIAPEASARGAPGVRVAAAPPRAAPPGPAARAAAPAARTAARSNVVPIGGRLGGAAAPALDEHDLDADEPTRVGSVDLADLEAKALAAERAAAEQKLLETKRSDDLFPDVKRPPTGKISTRDPAGLPPPPKPLGRPDTGRIETGRSDTGKNPVPLVSPKPLATKPAAKPAPKPAPLVVDEPDDLPFDEPSFADVPAAPAPLEPAAFAPVAAASPFAPVAPLAPVAPVVASVPAREEKRRGGGIPIPALIAIAGATAFGGVMAFMIGTRYLGPTPTVPEVAVTTTIAAPPPTTTVTPPPTAAVATPPEVPPATTEVPPEVVPTTTTPPTTTAVGGTHTGRPHTGTTAPAGGTTTTPATGPATGRFAEFEDDGEGPARIATTGRTSLADEAEGTGSTSSTRGQQELTADQIRAVITRERPAVNRCWESELRRLGQAATVRLDVDLTIGGSGTVTRVTTRGQSVGTLSDCIERNVRRWRFPPVSGSTQTSFPLVFSGTE